MLCAVLKLLPPMCRDCGKTAKDAKLSPYLDFHLCPSCIARRERALLSGDRPRRKPQARKQLKKRPGTRRGKRRS
jgi:hypothetical protein